MTPTANLVTGALLALSLAGAFWTGARAQRRDQPPRERPPAEKGPPDTLKLMQGRRRQPWEDDASED